VPGGELGDLLQESLRRTGAGERMGWDRNRRLGASALASCWPGQLPPPLEMKLLERGWLRRRLELRLELAGGDPNASADALLQHWRTLRSPKSARSDAGRTDAAVAEEVAATSGASVVPPGQRTEMRAGRRWKLGADDVFTLVGPLQGADIRDDGLDVRTEDLPWLTPGDRLWSERRGACRVVAVEVEDGRIRLRDREGGAFKVRTAELTAEFWFDDGQWTRERVESRRR